MFYVHIVKEKKCSIYFVFDAQLKPQNNLTNQAQFYLKIVYFNQTKSFFPDRSLFIQCTHFLWESHYAHARNLFWRDLLSKVSWVFLTAGLAHTQECYL